MHCLVHLCSYVLIREVHFSIELYGSNVICVCMKLCVCGGGSCLCTTWHIISSITVMTIASMCFVDNLYFTLILTDHLFKKKKPVMT